MDTMERLPADTAKSLVLAYAEKKWADVWSLSDSRITYDETATRRKTHGIKRFMTILQEWGAAFPDSNIEIRGEKGSGNSFTYDLRWTGTHGGPIETPGGTIVPTGKKIDLSVTMVVEIGESGMVESVTHDFDMEVMEKQIEHTARGEQPEFTVEEWEDKTG
jgi:predicted ester cyclase